MQFSETVTAQANLEVEAYRLDPLYHNFRNLPVTRFPQPLYAGPGVILESFEPGCIVSDFFATDERMASDINAAKAEAKQTRKDESNFEKSQIPLPLQISQMLSHPEMQTGDQHPTPGRYL